MNKINLLCPKMDRLVCIYWQQEKNRRIVACCCFKNCGGSEWSWAMIACGSPSNRLVFCFVENKRLWYKMDDQAVLANRDVSQRATGPTFLAQVVTITGTSHATISSLFDPIQQLFQSKFGLQYKSANVLRSTWPTCRQSLHSKKRCFPLILQWKVRFSWSEQNMVSMPCLWWSNWLMSHLLLVCSACSTLSGM